jgi:hypothetical protein
LNSNQAQIDYTIDRFVTFLGEKYSLADTTFTWTGIDNPDADIICDFSGTISSTSGADLQEGTETLVSAASTYFRAYTGAIHIECVKKSFDGVTGKFVITCTWSKAKIEVLRGCIQNSDVRAANDLTAITTASKAAYDAIIAKVVDDVGQLQTYRDTVASNANAGYVTVTSKEDSLNTSLVERKEAYQTYVTERNTAQTTFETTTDLQAQIEQTLQGFKKREEKIVLDLAAAKIWYEKNVAQAAAEVDACTRDYIDAKLDQGDDTKKTDLGTIQSWP